MMADFQTLPAMHRYVVDTYRHAHAFNFREGSGWVHTSTESFAEGVRRMALGLVALGVKRGQSVGIYADPSPWWLMADMAILAAGGVSVPLFPNSSEPNLRFKVKDADMKYVFVSDRELADKFRHCRRLFSKVILHGNGPDKGGVLSSAELMGLGDELSAKQPALFSELCEQARPDDVATIIYTSGSTGSPKGVVLTHRNIISQVRGAVEWFPLNCSADRSLSVLPLAHVFERVVVYFCVSRGVGVWFVDRPKNVGVAIQEVKPTCMAVVPRLLEKVYAAVVSEIETAGVLRKPLGRWALKVAHTSNPGAGHHGLQYRLAQQLVYPKMRQALGGRLKTMICGGAPLSPRLCRFFLNIGVPVYQGYGMTEASPVICANRPDHNRVGTVGCAFPGVEVMIAGTGEILTRGPSVMVGYHNDPETTRATIDADGWLHTGDLGKLDDEGYLTITGRIKEVCKTAGGKYVCPSSIEKSLTASPLIDQAYVIAADRAFPSCLLFPDTDYLRKMMGKDRSNGTPDDELLASPELETRLKTVLGRVNDSLEPWERLRAHRVVSDKVTVEDGGLTPTQKLRRQVLDERYKELIESMYSRNGGKNGNHNGNGHGKAVEA